MSSIGEIVVEVAGKALAVIWAKAKIPAVVAANAAKAIGRLCGATTDNVVARLESSTAEIRALSKGREVLIASAAEQYAKSLPVSPEFAKQAAAELLRRMMHEKDNIEAISVLALQDLSNGVPPSEDAKEPISDDWLNQFENEARMASSDDVRLMFAKILAGEIRKPRSFSIRTVRLLSELDPTIAGAFRRLCSLTISMKSGYPDARVPSMGRDAAQNGLREFGLSFDTLNSLFEHGLIIAEYNSHIDYSFSVPGRSQYFHAMVFQKENYALVRKDGKIQSNALEVHGVALSVSGRQLLPIVDIEPAEHFLSALTTYFNSKGFELAKVK